MGIHIYDSDGDATIVPAAGMSTNEPKTLTFVVPNLADGKYIIKVTTQYANGGIGPTPITSRASAELTVDAAAKPSEPPAEPTAGTAAPPIEPSAEPTIESA